MTQGRNLTRLVGWHPSPAGLVARLDDEIARRGGGKGVQSAILNEALAAYFAALDGQAVTTAVTTGPAAPRKRRPAPAATFTPPEPAPKACRHPNFRGVKGYCPDCHQPVGYK